MNEPSAEETVSMEVADATVEDSITLVELRMVIARPGGTVAARLTVPERQRRGAEGDGSSRSVSVAEDAVEGVREIFSRRPGEKVPFFFSRSIVQNGFARPPAASTALWAQLFH